MLDNRHSAMTVNIYVNQRGMVIQLVRDIRDRILLLDPAEFMGHSAQALLLAETWDLTWVGSGDALKRWSKHMARRCCSEVPTSRFPRYEAIHYKWPPTDPRWMGFPHFLGSQKRGDIKAKGVSQRKQAGERPESLTLRTDFCVLTHHTGYMGRSIRT